MRVHSLDLLTPLMEPATVLVNSDRFAVELSSFESSSVFFRSVPDRLPNNIPFVVVNPTSKIIGELADRGAFQMKRVVEIWSDSAGIPDLVGCLENFENLAVYGASTDAQWFRLGIRSSDLADRPGQDLVLGLKASLLRKEKDVGTITTPSHPREDTNLSLRAELVRVATRIAKPIKPYLPTSVTHMLYKTLGALR